MRKFSLAQLEAFLWICRLGTFHAAAERLSLTQPTISLRIRELESALGTRLFERRGHGMRLTTEGTILLRYAERGLDLFDEMEDRVRTGDVLQGSLRLGVSDTFAMTCLPELVAKLETEYPRLRIELTVINSTALSDMLMRKNLDLAFLTGPRQHRSIKVVPMGRTDVAWVSSAAKPIGPAVLRPRDLVDVPILSVTPPSPLHELMVDWCTSDGSPPPSFSTCNNIAVIARLVLAGVAASVLPVCVVQRELEAGTLVRYAQNPPLAPRLMCAAYPATSGGPGMDAVLHIARDAFAHSRLFDSV